MSYHQQEHCSYALSTLELRLRGRFYIESCIPTSGTTVSSGWCTSRKSAVTPWICVTAMGMEHREGVKSSQETKGKSVFASMVKTMLSQKTGKGLFKSHSPLGTSQSFKGWSMSFPSSLVVQNLKGLSGKRDEKGLDTNNVIGRIFTLCTISLCGWLSAVPCGCASKDVVPQSPSN